MCIDEHLQLRIQEREREIERHYLSVADKFRSLKELQDAIKEHCGKDGLLIMLRSKLIVEEFRSEEAMTKLLGGKSDENIAINEEK